MVGQGEELLLQRLELLLRAGIADGTLVFADTRSANEVRKGAVKGSIAIPGSGPIATQGSWAYDPETDDRGIVLLADDADHARTIWDHLVRVGIDKVVGYRTSIDGLETFRPTVIQPQEVEGFERDAFIDVRAKSEHAAGHIPGSTQLHAGRLLWQQDELPKDGTILVYCQSGVRQSVAANALRSLGYDVAEVEGAFSGWAAAGLPVEK